MGKETITGVMHRFIYTKLIEKCNIRNGFILKRKEVMHTLWSYNMPSIIQANFLKEMERYGLIKVKNKQSIRLLKDK